MLTDRFKIAFAFFAEACESEGIPNGVFIVKRGMPSIVMNTDNQSTHFNDEFGWYELKEVRNEQ